MKRVAVSLGHSPDSPGATYLDHTFSEYTILAPLFGYVVNALQRREIGAYIVPTGELKDKVKYINDGDFDLAIELHLNADPDPDTEDQPIAQGCETLYFDGSFRGKQFATAIQNSLTRNFKVLDRGVKARRNLAFLRDTLCPAIILEPTFIDVPAFTEGSSETIELFHLIISYEYVASLVADAIEQVIKNI